MGPVCRLCYNPRVMRAALPILLTACLLALACHYKPEVIYIVLTPTPVAPIIDAATATPPPTPTPAPTPTPTAAPSPTFSHSQALHRVDARPQPHSSRYKHLMDPDKYEYMVDPDDPRKYQLSQPLHALLHDCVVAAWKAGVRDLSQPASGFILPPKGEQGEPEFYSSIRLPEGFEISDLVDGDPLACLYP